MFRSIHRTHSFTMRIVLTFLFFWLVEVASGQDIEIKSNVDRTEVAVGQQFILTIEIAGSDAQSVDNPQLPDLSEYADYIGSSSSQNFQMINNNVTISKSTTNYFIARVEGKHEIPPVTLTYKGKVFSSQGITLRIIKGSVSSSASGGQPAVQPRARSPQSQIISEDKLEGNLFLQAEVDRRSVYPNQPVYISYKIYTRVNLTSFAFSKLPDLLGFWSEEFTMPQRPVTYEKAINGKRFLVAEIKKSALFPTTSGEKKIDPMEIECEVRLRGERSTQDLFERFFNDDFFGEDIFGRRVRTRISSKPLKIEVKPFPVEGRLKGFSGIAGNFNMTAALDRNQVQINEAVTLKVRISGTGNIKMLPQPDLTFPSDIETYEPKVSQEIDRSGSTIKGSKAFEYVLIPRFAGKFRIRPFVFTYFDPAKRIYQKLSSPEFMIQANAGLAQGVSMPSGLKREEIKIIGKDIRFIKLSSDTFHRADDYFYKKFWCILFLVLPLVVLGGAFVCRRRLNRMAENLAYARNRRANQMAKKRLGRAHKLMAPEMQKEFYAEVSHALLGFVADKLNLSAAGFISDEVVDKLRERRVREDVISELLECLGECDYQRFAPSDSTEENMRELYERARSAIVDLDRFNLM